MEPLKDELYEEVPTSFEPLSVEEAEELLKKEGDDAKAVEEVLEDPDSLPPSLQYDPADDPEMKAEIKRESIKAARRQRLAMREANKSPTEMCKEYAERRNYEKDSMSIADFLESGIPNATQIGWYKRNERDQKALMNRWNIEIARTYGAPEVTMQEIKEAAMNISTTSSGSGHEDTQSSFDPSYQVPDEDLAAAAEYNHAIELNDLNTPEKTAEAKFNVIYGEVYNILFGHSKHFILCGDAGIGKTYTVQKCLDEKWQGSWMQKAGFNRDPEDIPEHKQVKPEILAGAPASNASELVAFFWKYSDKQFIILDDADAFLKEKNQRIMNILKSLLASDNTDLHPKPTYISADLRKAANRKLNRKHEGVVISYDAKRLRESNVLELAIDGKVVASDPVTFEEKKEILGNRLHIRENDTNYRGSFARDVLGRKLYERVLNTSDIEDIIPEDVMEHLRSDCDSYEEAFDQAGYNLFGDFDAKDGSGKVSINDVLIAVGERGTGGSDDEDDGNEGIPASFVFSSRLMMISNLYLDQLDEAVKSRMHPYAVTLDEMEFAARLKQILPNMLIKKTDDGISPTIDTTLDIPEIEYVRDTVYAWLKLVISWCKGGVQVGGKVPVVGIKLQFRIINDLYRCFMRNALQWCDKDGKGMSININTLPIIAKGIKPAMLGEIIEMLNPVH